MTETNHANALTLIHSDYKPTQDRDATIADLQAQVNAERSSTFNRTFLAELLDNPDLSLADAWEKVERHFAQKSGTKMRSNPYS